MTSIVEPGPNYFQDRNGDDLRTCFISSIDFHLDLGINSLIPFYKVGKILLTL